MTNEIIVREAFANQAAWCDWLGSPFTAQLMRGLGIALNRNSEAGKIVLDWSGPPDAMGDSVPLRVAGALHALVVRNRLPELAKLYPPAPLPDLNILTQSAMSAIADVDEEICEWLRYTPQTNEVARSSILYAGMMDIAKQTKLPLALYELGASAGLNLFPDMFSYQFGASQFGWPGSTVKLSPEWTGPTPPDVEPKIVSRRGCDLAPLDICNVAHRERLLAYIWPDQPQRISRIEGAIKLALKNPPQIDKSDAANWVDKVISPQCEKGVVRVLFHSVAFQYFPQTSKQRITDRMEEVGAKATHDNPLAWLAFEDKEGIGKCLTSKLWPGGEERVLAKGDAHCSKIEWLG